MTDRTNHYQEHKEDLKVENSIEDYNEVGVLKQTKEKTM